MPDQILTLQELNRATLARQMLLARKAVGVVEAVGRLAGLQAQVPNPPYISLWARVQGFRREDLTHAMEERQVVRAAMLRSTLHLVTAEDFLRFRQAIQPALEKGLRGFFGKRAEGLDIPALVAATRVAVAAEPRAMGALRELLAGVAPGRDPAALSYAVRTFLPLVQVPPGGTWGRGSASAYTTPEVWLGQPVAPEDHVVDLMRRYLGAFGPATGMDAQAWLGRTKLKEAMEVLRPELRTFRDEAGRELFDLPDAPRPDGAVPAPVRFLPEYDNLLLAHADRSRVIADAHRPRVFLTAGRVRATFLVDGFVRGVWRTERAKKSATLTLEPFERLDMETRRDLEAEGEKLLHFVEDDAAEFRIIFASVE